MWQQQYNIDRHFQFQGAHSTMLVGMGYCLIDELLSSQILQCQVKMFLLLTSTNTYILHICECGSVVFTLAVLRGNIWVPEQ